MNRELFFKTELKRKNGKLYYWDLDGDICEAVMCGITQHNPPKYQDGTKVLKIGLKREEGFIYTVGKDGHIYRSDDIEEWLELLNKFLNMFMKILGQAMKMKFTGV